MLEIKRLKIRETHFCVGERNIEIRLKIDELNKKEREELVKFKPDYTFLLENHKKEYNSICNIKNAVCKFKGKEMETGLVQKGNKTSFFMIVYFKSEEALRNFQQEVEQQIS